MFTNFVDIFNFNAQSLNVREIARRLNPSRFTGTLFYRREPDPRLLELSHLRLIKLPPRLGSLRMLAESLRGYDILFKPGTSRFGYIYLHLPRMVRRNTVTVEWVEAVISVHLRDAEPHVRELFNSIYHKMDVYVATTEYVAETTRQDFQINASTVICTGVDPQVFCPPSQRSVPPIQVLFVGQLIERKGPQFVLNAAAKFRKVQFVIVGERRGTFNQELFKIVEKEQLTNVSFLPPMPRKLLAKLMRESHILLHPAIVESPGKTIIEAAATGLPAIIFSHYRSPATLDGVTGFQVNTFDEMLDRLEQLIEDGNLRRRMGESAVDYAKQFDWNVVVPQWEEVFQNVVYSKT
jgi:glycosyltransferase involved in cell wall biosynthesis